MGNLGQEAILEIAKRTIGDEVNGLIIRDVKLIEVSKRDGIKTGLQVEYEDKNVCPVIYGLEDFENELDVFNAIEKVSDKVSEVGEEINFNFTDESKFKVRLVNKRICEENGYLEDKEYKEILNLAAIPVYDLGEGQAVVLDRKILKAIGLGIEEWIRVAIENTKLNCLNMAEVLGILGAPEIDECPMNVVSTSELDYGPMLMLDNQMLEDIHTEMGDFYIIPSSVHEVLVIPERLADPQSLNDMIGSVNATCLSPEDYLSDSAYFYDGKLRVA